MDLINSRSMVLATDAGPVEPSNVGFGSIVLLIAVAVLMAWMAYLWLNARRSVRRDDPAPNVSPPISDEELEGPKLTRILMAAVVSSAVLAGVMSVYYATESRRQANAAEKIHEKDVEEGEKWFDGSDDVAGFEVGGGAGPHRGVTVAQQFQPPGVALGEQGSERGGLGPASPAPTAHPGGDGPDHTARRDQAVEPDVGVAVEIGGEALDHRDEYPRRQPAEP